MNKWLVEYQNEEFGPEGDGFRDWWDVSDGQTTYRADTEGQAVYLAAILNAVGA